MSEERLAELERRLAEMESKRFEEIDVERINVIESDGRLRMAISNSARGADPILGGRTFQRQQGREAGIIFFNEEGDECGGLGFCGRLTDDGYVAGGGLMFDQFRQDQVVGVHHGDSNGRRVAGLEVWERPNNALIELVEEQERVAKLSEAGQKEARSNFKLDGFANSRVFVGRTPEQDAVVFLKDSLGRVRIKLTVPSDGTPSIEMLDTEGAVVWSGAGEAVGDR